MMKRLTFGLACMAAAGVALGQFPTMPKTTLAAGAMPEQSPAVTNTTVDNLDAACTADRDAKSHFSAYAVKADGEGYKGAATLFRALARQQEIRLAKHGELIKKIESAANKTGTAEERAARDNLAAALKAMKKAGIKPAVVDIRSTHDNLASALQTLTKQRDVTYPDYARQAAAEENEGAVMAFKGGAVVTGDSVKLIEQAAKDLDAWKAAKTLMVCEICAEIVADPAVTKCPVCAAPKEKFVTVK